MVFEDFIDCVEDSAKDDDMEEYALAGLEDPYEQVLDN